MFLQSYWIVPLKTTSSVDLFWKEMSRKHFLSCLDSFPSLTVYINSEVLESDSFSFCYFTLETQILVFSRIFYSTPFKVSLCHGILHWTWMNKLHERHKCFPWDTLQGICLSQGNGKLEHAYFLAPPPPREYRVSLYTASKISRHKHLLRKINCNKEHLLKIWHAHSLALLIKMLRVKCWPELNIIVNTEGQGSKEGKANKH